MTMMGTQPIFFFFISCLGSVLAQNQCNPSTCVEGKCVDNNCECLPDFTGPDCSVPFVSCPDGERECFNGSECVRNNEKDLKTKEYKYHCDCSVASDISSFAGIQCEHSITSVCESGVSVSTHSYCVNRGECVKMVRSDEIHAGCICPADFEGRHCQYLKGMAPPEELELMTAEEGAGMSGFAMFFIIVIPAALVGMMGWVVYKRRMTSKEPIVHQPQMGGPPQIQVTDATGDQSKGIPGII